MTNLNNTSSAESIVIDGRLQLIAAAMITLTAVGKWNDLIAKLKDKPDGTTESVTDTFEWTANLFWKRDTDRRLLPTKITLSIEFKGRASNIGANSQQGVEPFIRKFDPSRELQKGQTFVPGEELVIEARGGFEQGASVAGVAKFVCTAVEES